MVIREPLIIGRTLNPLLNERSYSTFTLEICDHTDSVLRSSSTIHFARLDVCQGCSVSANHSPLSSQSSLLTLSGKLAFMYCNRLLASG